MAKTNAEPLTEAGFIIHSTLANRAMGVRMFIRNPDGMSFLVDRKGRIYSPDLKSGTVMSSHTDISKKALSSLLRMKIITKEQHDAHLQARKEARQWRALLDIEEIGKRLRLRITECTIVDDD